ncbi:MAG: macro domain-containing protein [Cyanobacteria bacterium P01_E01_bin.42]
MVIYHLRARDVNLAEAWQKFFADTPEVIARVGDIFDTKVDALISPANCFGFMDGGIDLIYSKYLGWHVQDRLRETIRQDWNGELPVGLALLVETDREDIPYLISAPTMRAPVNVSQTLNAYFAFRAALRVIQKQNEKKSNSIQSVACPGLATGTGEMPPMICAKQMYEAYKEVVLGKPFEPSGVNDALLQHYRLLREEDD